MKVVDLHSMARYSLDDTQCRCRKTLTYLTGAEHESPGPRYTHQRHPKAVYNLALTALSGGTIGINLVFYITQNFISNVR